MTTVTRTFDVRPAPAVVVDYLKDFSNAEEWDPGTVSCTRQDAGPVQVGSTWHNVSKIAGVSTELTYTLQQLTDDTIVLVGTNDTARSVDTITVVPGPDGSGSRVTYEYLREANGPEPYTRHLFPGYAHMDCFIGKNAAKDVYPTVLAELDRHSVA